MKKYLLCKTGWIVCGLFTYINFTFCQTTIISDNKNTISILVGKPGLHSVYIPPDPNVFNARTGRTASISYTFDESCDGCLTWPEAAKGAFNFAVNIWKGTVKSTVTIEITAKWKDLGDKLNLSQSIKLGSYSGLTTDNPKYQTDTYYAVALANKMQGSDINPNEVDMIIECNSNSDWYYETFGQPNTKFDFITAVVHEIAHGLGFSSSARMEGNTLVYKTGNGSTVFPNIYDRLIIDGNGKKLTDLSSPSTELTDFLKNKNNYNLFWNGAIAVAVNANNKPKLYTPTTWEVGASISHLDESTFNLTTSALMIPFLIPGEAFHNPGEVGIGIMSDIGWEASLYNIGIEDYITIYNYNINPPYSEPDFELNIGGTYHYTTVFVDKDPIGDVFVPFGWKLEALYNGGKYLIQQTISHNSDWTFTLSDLPTGYQWSRTFDGKVEGVLTAYGQDLDGIDHTTTLNIMINYIPDKPEVSIRNVHVFNSGNVINSPGSCSEAEVSFFARGATSYIVHLTALDGTTSYYIPIQNGQFSIILDQLDPWVDYAIQVSGVNNVGYSIISDYVIRYHCKEIIIVVPNPAFDRVKFIIKKEIGKISDVELRKIDDSGHGKHIIVNPPRKEVEIAIGELTSGYYLAKIKDDKNEIHTAIFLKQ